MKMKIIRYLLSVGIAIATALFLLGCGESMDLPTANQNIVQPPSADISGLWIGTYNTNDNIDCDTSKSLSAKAAFQENGSAITGKLIAYGPCGLDYPFQGTIEGNHIKGVITGALNPTGSVTGSVNGATLEIVASNGYGFVMGQLHLHR